MEGADTRKVMADRRLRQFGLGWIGRIRRIRRILFFRSDRSMASPDPPSHAPESPDAPRIAAEDAGSSMRRLGVLLRPYARSLIGVLVMLFGLTLVNMSPPWMLKLLVDDVFTDGDLLILWLIIGGYLIYYAVRNLLYFNSKYTTVRVGENVAFTLRKQLFERMQQKTLHFYRRQNPGKVSGRVMSDSFVIQQFIQDQLPTLLQSLLMFLGLVAATYAMNWPLALAATIVLPLHLVAFRYFRRPIKESSRDAQNQLAVVHGNLIEKFLGAEVVKGFTAEGRENQAFEAAIDSSRSSQLRSQKYHVWQKVVADVLVGVGTVALIGFGAFQVVADRMTSGQFMQFFGYVMMLYPTVLELMSGFAKFTRSAACVDRVFEMLETDGAEVNRGKQLRPEIGGKITFDHVSFEYDQGQPVLQDVAFEVPEGKVCAVVGPSGTGKSTLVNLVPRFADPTAGRVLVDGIDARALDLRHLREAIGIAFQECFLFNSSILENLRYAQPNASMEHIVETAKRTGAHDFISRLPEGYHTALGENGISLSRGEAQRITLTRAMLKTPRILVLDEATASIDAASQQQIVPAILDFMQGKTTLMITHNPELLVHADMVVQIEGGRVVYQGPPAGTSVAYRRPSPTFSDDLSYELMARRRRPSDTGVWGAMRMLIAAGGLAVAMALGAPAAAQPQDAADDSSDPAAAAVEAAGAAVAQGAADGGDDGAAAAAAATTGRLVSLPGLNQTEIEELIDVVLMRLDTRLGYRRAGGDIDASLPDPPPGVRHLNTHARQTDDGLRLIQVGYKTFRSQPPHVYVAGRTLGPIGNEPNPDIATIEKLLGEGQKALQEQYATLQPSDLATRKIGLSYVDPARAAVILSTFGYEVIKPGAKPDPTKLPAVMVMPATEHHNTVVGPAGDFPLTEADPVNDLLVIFHPAHPEQYSQVLAKVRKLIDIPARQIMIEAMVLEISQTGLERLGVEWELESPLGNLTTFKLGRLPTFATQTNNEAPTLDVGVENLFGEFTVKLQALLREGQAEVLSRPSVLTLNNRMANMSVEERIPVVTSISQGKNDSVLVKFEEKVAGIKLNVRPRVAEDGEEISMQIVASVSARVPNADVVVKNNEGDEVARSPTIAAREVKTYARIANNTPFIIGGLIARDDTAERDKVPVLGDLPLVGPSLFSATRVNKLRSEVIIVITPYVLPENGMVGRNMPKDEDAFDSFGQKLFRDAYRIRAEDVFDLAFITDNPQLREMKRLANEVVRQNFRLASHYPFNRFVGDRIPGERILVFRQMYEVIKRLNLGDRVNHERLIFFKPAPQTPSGFDVTFLHEFLADRSNVELKRNDGWFAKDGPGDAAALFAGLDGKAVALTYTLLHYDDLSNVLSQPVPQINVYDCPSDEAYQQMLWDLNQPDDQGRQRYTILLREPGDLVRVKRAVLLKRVVQLNANRQALTLNNFSIGRQLLMPTVKPNKVYLVDEQTAKYFFYTEMYYSALQEELVADLTALRGALALPEVRRYLDGYEPPQTEPVIPRIDIPRIED